MILKTNNIGPYWWFTDEECKDFAYICSCMPTDRMSRIEVSILRAVEVKFRLGNGGLLTPKQWDAFYSIATRYSNWIQEQSESIQAIRALARGLLQ